MPFKSEAQRRKFYELHKQGKISKAVLEAFESETKGKLPEKAPTKKKKEPPAKASKAWFAKVHK